MKRYIKCSSSNLSEELDSILYQSLEEFGVSIEEVHLFNEAQAHSFQKLLRSNLKKAGLDLSFKSAMLPTGRLSVGGNLDGMSSSIVRGLIRLGWNKVSKSESDIKDCLNDGYSFYIEDRYGYCKPATFDEFMRVVNLGSSTQYRGIGSQASVAETHVTLYEDNDYNLKVDRATLIYD